MTVLVPLVLFGWLPLVVLLFSLLEKRRAVVWATAASWCFLPVASFEMSGLPDFTKTSVSMYGILLGTAIFNSDLLVGFRPRWVDAPVVIWCLCPLVSSLSNGLGLYDGATAVLNQTITWGIPYSVGRLYFHKIRQIQDLAWPTITCCLIYIPLCLYEVRMSPQLHNMVYGFLQHSFDQTARGGGWRPMVFMNHGLQVAMWMSTAVILVASWYLFGGKREIPIFGFEFSSWAIMIPLVVTFILLKSTGAIVLTLAGLCILVVAAFTRSAVPILIVPVLCFAYFAVRIPTLISPQPLVAAAASFSEERAGSLKFRFDNENMLIEKANQRPVFGWAGWGRSRVYDELGKDISVTDGLWIIAYGQYGLVGLLSLYTVLLLGPSLIVVRCNPRFWRRDPSTALGAGVAVACMLAAVDSLPNAMQIPVMTLAVGVTAGIGSQSSIDWQVRKPGSLQSRSLGPRKAFDWPA